MAQYLLNNSAPLLRESANAARGPIICGLAANTLLLLEALLAQASVLLLLRNTLFLSLRDSRILF